jgi:hypothetical protein
VPQTGRTGRGGYPKRPQFNDNRIRSIVTQWPIIEGARELRPSTARSGFIGQLTELEAEQLSDFQRRVRSRKGVNA